MIMVGKFDIDVGEGGYEAWGMGGMEGKGWKQGGKGGMCSLVWRQFPSK